MSNIALESNASGTGTFTIASPNSNTNRTLTLPDAAGAVVLDTATQTLTNKTLTSPTISGTPVVSGSLITAATAKSATSTSVDFDSIPSWVKRITIILNGVSTNSTSPMQIQIGDSGGIETSGYVGFNSAHGTGTASAGFTAAFGLTVSATYTTATKTYSGNLVLTNVSGNIWVASGMFASDAYTYTTAGNKTLSDVLTQIRVTTANGTDTFDAGTINILYE